MPEVSHYLLLAIYLGEAVVWKRDGVVIARLRLIFLHSQEEVQLRWENPVTLQWHPQAFPDWVRTGGEARVRKKVALMLLTDPEPTEIHRKAIRYRTDEHARVSLAISTPLPDLRIEREVSGDRKLRQTEEE